MFVMAPGENQTVSTLEDIIKTNQSEYYNLDFHYRDCVLKINLLLFNLLLEVIIIIIIFCHRRM